MNTIRIYIACLVLNAYLPAFSQDFNSDMVKVKSVYTNMKYYQCQYDIEVYYNEKLHSAIKMDAKFSDSLYLYNIGNGITALCNASKMLTIDKDLKIIFLGKRKSFKIDTEEYLNSVEDSTNYKIYSKKESNGWNTYTLVYDRGIIRQATITLNPASGFITYMDFINRDEEEYDWRSNGIKKTVIKISQLKTIEPLPSDYFSVGKYIIESKDGYLPTKAFKDYQVLDGTIVPKDK